MRQSKEILIDDKLKVWYLFEEEPSPVVFPFLHTIRKTDLPQSQVKMCLDRENYDQEDFLW